MRISRSGDALWVLYRDPASLVEIPFDTLRPRRRIHLASPPSDFDLSRETDDACPEERHLNFRRPKCLRQPDLETELQTQPARREGHGGRRHGGSMRSRTVANKFRSLTDRSGAAEPPKIPPRTSR